MNIVKKLSFLTFVFLFISATAFGATVTLKPSTVPIGAYLNGSDGDQYFVQSLVITFNNDGAGDWLDAEEVTITLPDGMTIADVSDDGNFNDEVSLVSSGAAAIGAATATAATTNSSIVVAIATASAIANGDQVALFFPVVTEDDIVDGTQATYSFSSTTGDEEASWPTPTVTYSEDVLSYVTFSSYFKDGDQSSEKGDVYPTAAQKVTAVLPNIVEDLDVLANNVATDGASDWDGITLDTDDNAVDGATLADAETQYYLWASQNPNLIRVDEESGAHRPIAAQQPTRESVIPATGDAGDPIDSDVEGGDFDASQLNGKLLEEGTWYFYITSSLTSDWVLAKSDSVAIRHWPVFDASPAGGIVDFDGDGIFESGLGNDDNVSVMYLESGGGVGTDGTWGGSNAKNAKFHWNVTDVDDNANVKIFKSTTDGLTTKATLLADANTVQISPDTLYEEGSISQYWNWLIYTDANNFEDAGDYYIYMLADDGKNSNVYQMAKDDGTDFQLMVKHFPNLEMQEIGYLHDENTGDVDIDFETANQQYITFNWGLEVDDDLDADGDQLITLYISDKAKAASGYNDNVALVDPSILADAAVDEAGTVLVGTVLDTADGRNDNRFSYDLRNSGLPAGTYHMYAVISEKGDAQVIQLNSGGDDDRPVELTHSPYFLPTTPPEREIVNLKSTDRYAFTWDGFDMDATSTDLRVAVVMLPEGTASIAGAIQGDALVTAGGYYLTSAGTGQLVVANADAPVMADGKVVVDFSELTTDMAGGAAAPSGDYDVYYIYAVDGDFTNAADDICIKADGYINIDAAADPATSFALTPNRIVAEKGDTISLDIYATDGGGAETAMIVSVYLDIPAEKFTVVDQDNTEDGIQPWLDESVNFNGVEFIDTLRTNGSVYELDYVEYASGGDALATSQKIGTVQLVAANSYNDNALEKHNITFSTTGSRQTSIIGDLNNTFAVTVPATAATVELVTRGVISGHVEIEARNAEGEDVDIYVVPEGGISMITDADFLAANGLSSANDTLTYTLDAGGYFEIINVPTGTYDVFVHKDGYLDQRIASKSVQPLSITNVDFEGVNKLVAGDCAGYEDALGNIIPDNQVSDADVNAIGTAFNTEPTDPDWNVYADFDDDGHIFVTDLNLATKNTGSGEGILYKKTYYNGSNEGAKFILAESGENRFAIKAEKVAHLRTYAAELSFNPDEWKVEDVVDGVSSYMSAFNFHRVDGNTLMIVSSVYGNSALAEGKFELANFGLTPMVENPMMPELTGVTLVDAYGAKTKGMVESQLASNLPTEFSLSKNYPNPFNPTTNIKFAIPEQGMVKLVVYDLLGNKIRTLVSSDMKAGHYHAIWNATNEAGLRVSSGVYFYRLMVSNKVVDTRKMVLMK